MQRRVALEHVLANTKIEPTEAIAIVQQLIHAPAPTPLTPPFGPPTPATVCVGADGSVSCATCDTSLVVSELASFLEAMLPPSAPAVPIPGGLRYLIARAQMEVDAPPFDSLDQFSLALARHERGDRLAAVQRVVARVNNAGADGPLDRRRTDPAVTHLRRQLRDADARVYDQQLAIDALSELSGRPLSSRRWLAVPAGVLIGVLFVGAGQLMSRGDDPTPTPSGLPPAVQQSGVSVPGIAPAPHSAPAHTAAPPPKPAMTHTARRTTRRAATAHGKVPEKPRRFEWLRTRFVFRGDPL